MNYLIEGISGTGKTEVCRAKGFIYKFGVGVKILLPEPRN